VATVFLATLLCSVPSAGEKDLIADVLFYIYFLQISVRPIIKTSTGPIIAKFAGLEELRP